MIFSALDGSLLFQLQGIILTSAQTNLEMLLHYDLPTHCDADGEVFSVNHALNCSKGGLVYGRHNELRDLNCSLLELAGLKQVISEPIVHETADKQLRADWAARGFWEP